MEQLSLHCAERDLILDVTLSAGDADRARRDSAFAERLVKAVLQQQEEDAIVEEQAAPVLEEAHEEQIFEGIDTLYRWNPTVLLLLETYRSIKQKFSNGKFSHKRLWENIAQIMTQKGHNLSGPQCSSELRSLKKTYKSIKDHNSKSGNERRTWQFFDIMEALFSRRAWSAPVAVASSTGCYKNKEQTFSSFVEQPKRVAKRKDSVSSLLEHSLLQKERHEENRAKRHQEKLEID